MKPVNLNQFRKQKTRAEKTARADANAVKFGRSKAQKQAERDHVAKLNLHLDDHKTEK
jgi:peroxiredoxin family protein